MDAKKTVRDLTDIDLKDKRVLVRVDFNVPIENGKVADDERIRASLPTINYLSKRGAKVILASHLGRPNGTVEPAFKLTPVAEKLAELTSFRVIQSDDCIGEEAESKAANLKMNEVLVLENVRFHREETKNDPSFSKSLADLADIFVLDAFGTAHRAHSSTVGVASYLPAYGGLLLYDEVKALTSMFSSPERPFLAIIGGSKVSSKLGVLKHLLDKVDTLAIVGAMAFTFLKSMGKEVGKSLVEDSYLDEAKQFLEKAKASRTKIVLPVDQVVVEKVDPLAESDVVEIDGFSPSMIGVDAGPATVAGLAEIIKASKMILWNGPLGIFEMDPFSVGTSEIARLLATVDAKTIVGGGDSVSALSKAGVKDKMTHISTGGGASLAFLEGVELPGLSILEDKDDA